MSKKQERINQILNLFSEKDCMSCKQLSERLGVSEMTIRRDIQSLQESNIVARGAKAGTFSLVEHTTHAKEDYEVSVEASKYALEKDRIGKFAATLISPGDTVIIDTGTTTVRLAHHIPDDMEFTALCYNFGVFTELQRKRRADLILTGGQFNRQSLSFNSNEGIEAIGRFRANKFFVAASGIHDKLGLTCGYRSEIPNKQTSMSSSLTKILLADSSKFGTVRAAYFAELEDIDIMITDGNISDEWRELINAAGIRLYEV